MVQKPAILIITLLSVAGCWFFFQNYEIEGLNRIRLTQRNGEAGWSGPAVSRRDDRLRIASFNIQVFGPTKLGKQHVLETLASKLEELNHTETAWGWSPSKKVLASTEMLEVSSPVRFQYFPVSS